VLIVKDRPLIVHVGLFDQTPFANVYISCVSGGEVTCGTRGRRGFRTYLRRDLRNEQRSPVQEHCGAIASVSVEMQDTALVFLHEFFIFLPLEKEREETPRDGIAE